MTLRKNNLINKSLVQEIRYPKIPEPYRKFHKLDTSEFLG